MTGNVLSSGECVASIKEAFDRCIFTELVMFLIVLQFHGFSALEGASNFCFADEALEVEAK